MRAVVVTRYGGPEVLDVVERPDPEPAAGEVLVRLDFAGVNFTDVYNRNGGHNLPVVAAVVVMTSILFALCGFINAVYANTFDDINIVPTFVLTPLTYLGGVFYSLELLPDFWATVSQANPLVYVVNAFRFGMLGVSDVNVGFAFGMIALFTAIAYTYSMHLLRTGKRLRT